MATNRPGLVKSVFRPIDSESDLPGDVSFARAARGFAPFVRTQADHAARTAVDFHCLIDDPHQNEYSTGAARVATGPELD
jgi:hypothetical protein